MDDLRFNLVRWLAYAATGPHSTEAAFCAAYAEADAQLTRIGWMGDTA